jgi:flagellar protein FlbD
MLKLTRLNNRIVAINPDHISWADALPDTTLELFTGHRLIVRESLDELVERVIAYRRALARMDEVVIDVTSGEPA